MYDFPLFPHTATLGSWVYQGVLFAIIFFSFKKTCLYSYATKRDIETKFFLPLLLIIYIITAFTDGDFSHYQMMVKDYGGPGSTGLERVYEYVIELTNQNYLLFRTVVFGTMVLLLLKMFNNYQIDKFSSIYFLFAVYIGTLAYSRASVGMTFFFLGLSFLYSDKPRVIKIILGALLVVASYFFHRSCIILIPLALLGLLPINKQTIPIILVTIFLLFSVLKGLASDLIVNIMSSENEELAQKAEIYASESSGHFSGNIIAWIMHIWDFGVYYVLFFFDAYYILNHRGKISKSILSVFNVTFGILLFAVLIYFFDMTSAAMYYRYLFMLMLPTTIMSTYLYQKRIMPLKKFQFLFWFGCLPTIENILYHVYYLITH